MRLNTRRVINKSYLTPLAPASMLTRRVYPEKDTEDGPLPGLQHVQRRHQQILIVEPRQLLPAVSQSHDTTLQSTTSFFSGGCLLRESPSGSLPDTTWRNY